MTTLAELVAEYQDVETRLAELLPRRDRLRVELLDALGVVPTQRQLRRSQASYVTIRERIKAQLKLGPRRVRELCDAIDASYPAVVSECSRAARDLELVRIGVGRYALPGWVSAEIAQ